MKKILLRLFITENLDQVNGIMLLLLKDRSTVETIDIFDKVKNLMTEKMMGRLAASKEDVRLISGYFSTKNEAAVKLSDPVFGEKLS